MATVETLQAWLADAEAARHKVAIGTKVEILAYGAKSITYGRANLADLDRYIRSLQTQIATATGARSPNRVIHFIPTDGCS